MYEYTLTLAFTCDEVALPCSVYASMNTCDRRTYSISKSNSIFMLSFRKIVRIVNLAIIMIIITCSIDFSLLTITNETL